VSVISNWIEAMQTTNLPEGARVDPVSKWIVLTRASVFPMTFFAAAIGGLLAVPSGHAQFLPWLACAVGLLLAHACNNLMNDFFDMESGVDTPEYARALYAPHPVLSGWVTREELLRAIFVVNALGVLVALYLTWLRGWPAAAFAVAGFFVSVFYVAPPLRFKHHGLGEPSVFVIWGPLMIAGTYFATTGTLPAWVWGASLPYGLLVTTVLFGKHIDKIELDSAKQIHTVPVLLGEPLARRTNQGLMLGFFASTVALVATGVLGLWALAILAATPRLLATLRFYQKPKPATPPKGYRGWPLWFVGAAFLLTRQAGGLLALGLVLDALFPLRVDLF
jgi:1,4-dihydroxy-2-naphthoate octaprenyltransferase